MPLSPLPEAVYSLLGKRVSEIRNQKDLSQENLAEWTGLTRASVANIEKGRQRIFVHQLFRFAQALNVEVTELLPTESEVMDASVPAAERQYLDRLKASSSSQKTKSNKKKV